MKTAIYLAIVMTPVVAIGQNEFAANAFYNEFRKVEADALQGFIENRGEKKNGKGDEYAVKLLLPLADSGKIVFPFEGLPYVEYYFQAAKTKTEIDERSVNLREAVLTAYGKPLYTRSETPLPGKYISNNTWYFTAPGESSVRLAVFQSSTWRDKGKYLLSFRIFGKAVAN